MCPLHIFNVSLEGSFLVQIITKRIFIHQCNTKHSDTSNTIIITNILILHQKNGNCLKFNFRFTAKIAQSQSLLNYGNDPMSVKKLYFAVFWTQQFCKGQRERGQLTLQRVGAWVLNSVFCICICVFFCCCIFCCKQICNISACI